MTVIDDVPGMAHYSDTAGTNYMFVYAAMRTGDLSQNYSISGGAFTGWSPGLGGICTSSPDVASANSANLWVFCRGNDGLGMIWANRWNGSTWSGWVSVSGGWFESASAATEYVSPSGRSQIRVYAMGWDGNIYEDIYDTIAATWGSWTGIGSPPGGCTSTPGTDWRVATELYVFCRGTDAAVWYNLFTGSSWVGWSSIGGSVMSSSGAADYYNAGWYIEVFGNSALPQNIVQQYRGQNPAWSGWFASFGGGCESGAEAADLPSMGYLYFDCRGFDDGVWFRQWNGSAWLGWQGMGRP